MHLLSLPRELTQDSPRTHLAAALRKAPKILSSRDLAGSADSADMGGVEDSRRRSSRRHSNRVPVGRVVHAMRPGELVVPELLAIRAVLQAHMLRAPAARLEEHASPPGGHVGPGQRASRPSLNQSRAE
jgi:hypothetical protein